MNAEALARAALEGFFGSQGFADMKASTPRKNAVKRVQQVLDSHSPPKPKDE